MSSARKRLWRFGGAIAVVALLGGAGGCATERMAMRYFPEGEPPPAAPTWPAPPQVPHYRYAGQLLGEDNFVPVDDRSPSRFKRFLAWLAGIDDASSERQRVVRPQMGVSDGAGRVYITDVGRSAVVVFDETDGRLLFWQQADRRASFVAPAGIAIGPGGEILVADAELGRVVRLDRNGDALGSFGERLVQRPTGVAYDAGAQHIYVVDSGAHDIKVFSASGQWLRTLGGRGERPGEFNGPTHIALDRGRLVVSDTLNARVQVLTATGDVVRIIGRRGLYLGNLTRPKGVAVDGDGNYYVVESYFDHLLVFDPQGQLLLPIGGAGSEVGKFFLPAGAWTDGKDRVFVADMMNGRVVVFQYLGQ